MNVWERPSSLEWELHIRFVRLVDLIISIGTNSPMYHGGVSVEVYFSINITNTPKLIAFKRMCRFVEQEWVTSLNVQSLDAFMDEVGEF